jgi:hypothetical protein
MRRSLINGLVLIAAITATARVIVADEGRLPVRSAAHQKALDGDRSFAFSEDDASMLFSLSQFAGNCQVHMIYDPTDSAHITFRFVRGEKKLIEVKGHTRSVFRAKGNVLYFAHFNTGSQGGVVTAHNLDSGTKLWETKLKGIRGIGHSGYSNLLTIYVDSRRGIDEKGEASVYISGHEGFGDYVEILDADTGKMMAHKVYREGWEK